jgi:hypothetical protein
MKAIIVGPDRGIDDALRAQGVEIERIDGIGSGDALEAAGVTDADLLVLTTVEEATAIPVALELNPGLRTVVYSPDTVPEFVRGQLDFALDPALLAPEAVAEELTHE